MRDLSMEQSGAGIANTRGICDNLDVSDKEISILRDLAKQVSELSARPVEEEKRRSWTALNDLQSTRPMIFCDPENGWNEIITPDRIKCIHPLARIWEMTLRKEIFWGTRMKDDRVIEPYFHVPYHYEDTGYGVSVESTGGENGGSYADKNPIADYERDFEKLKYPRIIVNYEKTKEIFDFAIHVFEGLLWVRLKGVWWRTLGMTWVFSRLRGLGNLLSDLIIHPDWVHRLMEFLCDSVIMRLDFLETHQLLSLNNERSYVGPGGFGWTNRLPQPGFDPDRVRLMDMWGFAESQDTLAMSPEMFREFIYPYQERILRRFGLNCYGCCEPLHDRWKYVKEFPRLRRVSVSPWADVQKMAEFLTDRYVFSLKPSPTPLATSKMNEEVVRRELAGKLGCAKGCRVEVIMRNNHTLGNNPNNAIRWCEIAREEINRLY